MSPHDLESALTRRSLLARAGAVGGGLMLSPGVSQALAAQSRTKLSLPTAAEMWRWNRDIAAAGPRLTGTSAHKDHIDFLEEQLRRFGLKPKRDKLTFQRWDPKRWALAVAGQDVPTTFYYPYSGRTPAAGVTGELVSCGKAPGEFSQAAGKIAIVECPCPSLPSTLTFTSLGRNGGPAVEGSTSVPFAQGLLQPADLKAAKAAGAVGVICVWRDISEELATGQVNPFSTPYQDCPAVWVSSAVGDGLLAKAMQPTPATLTMEADLVSGASTDTLYAVLPGSDRTESVLLNTHTDGPNVPEENGTLGLLGLARHFGGLSKGDRRRTMTFVFVTGHFQLPQFAKDGMPFNQATSRWLEQHGELWDGKGSHAKAVAGITMEHLGCREWSDNAAHTAYAATGRAENAFTYTTSTKLKSVYLKAAKGTKNLRTEADKPAGSLIVGEGGALYKAGIPGIALAPLPSYLIRVSKDSEIGKLDKNVFYGQVQTFAKAAIALDATKTMQIGKLLKPGSS